MFIYMKMFALCRYIIRRVVGLFGSQVAIVVVNELAYAGVILWPWENNIDNQHRCNNNGLLIIPISSTCFGRWIRPSSGALDCVYSLWYNATTILPLAGSLGAFPPHPGYRLLASSWMRYAISCKHSLVLLKMGEIIARNMLSWLELLINRYCCI